MGYYPPPQYPPQQPYYPQPRDSTDSIAMILEIIFGIFGLMGMGWLYAGNILTAVLIFIGFTILLVIEGVLSALTGGICACLAFPVNIAVAVVSGLRVQDYVRRTNARGSIVYVIIAGLIGFVVLCGLTVGLFFLLTSLGLLAELSY